MKRTGSVRVRAFTITELLVVVSIIALLIGLLLPTLSRARRAAQKSACYANQRQAALAQIAYASTYSDALAGPNTSGAHITNGYSNWRDRPTEPTQNMDWISPTLGEELKLPGAQDTDGAIPELRLRTIFDKALACPSNTEFYDRAEGGGNDLAGKPVTELRISSYSAPLALHTSTDDSDPVNTSNFTGGTFPAEMGTYRPFLSKVGRPSLKAATMEGSRYVARAGSGDAFEVSFNWYPWQSQGGNFMTFGPAIARITGDPHTFGRLDGNFTEGELRYLDRISYRHESQMVVGFLDGHCEEMTVQKSQNIDYWFPQGTRIIGRMMDSTQGEIVN